LCLSAGNRRNRIGKEMALFSQSLRSLGAQDSVRWCTGQCPVRQDGSGELAALGTSTTVYDINHRTVRWCTGLSSEPFTGEVVGLRKPSTAYGYNSPDCSVSQWSAGATVGRGFCARRVAEPTVTLEHRTVRCAPDSVRCANGSQSTTVGFAK
jgi:hypothetical protein